METTRELSVVPQQGMMTKMGIINPTFIEDAVIVSEKKQEKEHPNFIESNTSGITLEELETGLIMPIFVIIPCCGTTDSSLVVSIFL